MNKVFSRSFHSSNPVSNIRTLVCPGQGNVTPHLFKLVQKEVDEFKNPDIINFLQLSNEILKPNGIDINKYYSSKTYPGLNITSVELSKTSFVQPLVLFTTFLNQYICSKKYHVDLKTFDYMLGHSLGELSCLVIQDMIGLEEGLKIAYQRGKLMEGVIEKNDNNSNWGMVALIFPPSNFESMIKICKDQLGLSIANINGYNQIVCSGKVDELKAKVKTLKKIENTLIKMEQWKPRIRDVWLQTKIPAHNPIFEEIKDELRSIIHLKNENLLVPIVCNLNGLTVNKNAQRVVDNFIDVTSQPVQFVKCLETIENTMVNNPETDKHIFLNLSDITNGLTKRFFSKNSKCESYDLIEEVFKAENRDRSI